MQILCIETQIHPNPDINQVVLKGRIYNSILTGPIHKLYRGINMWHKLKELNPETVAHVSLFIPLPQEEGLTFEKRVEVNTNF